MHVVQHQQNRPGSCQPAKHPGNRGVDLLRPGGRIATSRRMRKQNPRKRNDRPEEPAQGLADLLHLGPRRRQQVDFKVLGKRFAKGGVGNGLADRLRATPAQERGTRTRFFQFQHQTLRESPPRWRSCPRRGAEHPRWQQRPWRKPLIRFQASSKKRKRLIVRVFGAPNQLWRDRPESRGPVVPDPRAKVRRSVSTVVKRRFLRIALPATTAAAESDDRSGGKPQPRRIGVEQCRPRRHGKDHGNQYASARATSRHNPRFGRASRPRP